MKFLNIPTIALLTVGAVLATIPTGCAFGTRKISLNYTPITTNSVQSTPKIAIVKFQDIRQDKVLVGEVRNGYGMKTAKVELQDADGGGWVANALAAELQKAGFDVAKLETTEAAVGIPVISGSLSHCYVTMFLTYGGQVKVQILLTKATVPILNKEYVGKSSALAMSASTGAYENILKKSLQDIMKTAVPDIIKALE